MFRRERKMKSIILATIVLAVMLNAFLSPASANTCPLTIDVSPNAHVKLEGSPISSDYTYTWTDVNSNLVAFTTSASGRNVDFDMPTTCVGTYKARLLMEPTSGPTSCANTCEVTLNCIGLCDCRVLDNVCVTDSMPTWNYNCPSALDKYLFSWYTRVPDTGTDPAYSTPLTAAEILNWGTKRVNDNQVYNPVLADLNQPTATSPKAFTWVTFVVAQDVDGSGAINVGDRVLKFCSQKVYTYYHPTVEVTPTTTS
jgi:hypothetical protein